jgi:hypothetical protein
MGELPGVLRQRHKHALGHVFGLVRIANHPQRRGIDEVNMTAHQLGERRLRTASGVIPHEWLVGLSVHS